MQINEELNISRKFEIRQMRKGEWYWVSKTVIKRYALRIGIFAVTVYHFLASMADKHQRCYPSQHYIAEHLGCSRTTVNRAIKKLEDCNLIYVERRDRYHCVYILVDVRCDPDELQMSTRGTSDVSQINTNNNKGIRNNNNTLRDQKNTSISSQNVTTREELLALDIAKLVGEDSNLKVYFTYAHKYPESFLRRMLSEVKRTPSHKIKKSRAALFAYLVRHYADKHS